MPYVRTAYLSLSETGHEITGHIHVIGYETMHSAVEDYRIPLTFFRPTSGIKDAEWLKDMLVQAIEQL
jgi:hypothetical protein